MIRLCLVGGVVAGLGALVLAGVAQAQSAGDLTESFTAANGQPVRIMVHAPRSGGGAVRLSDPDVVQQATAKAQGNPQLVDYYLFAVALDKVRATHAGSLSLDHRVYDIHTPANANKGWANLNFFDLSDVTIEGNYATIRLNEVDFRAGLMFLRDTRVAVRDLAIDWATPLTFPGHLVVSNGGQTRFRADDGYAIPDNAPVRQLLRYDTARRQFLESSRLSDSERAAWHADSNYVCGSGGKVKCFTPEGGRELRFDSSERMTTNLNTPVLATIRNNNFAALLVNGGQDITLVNDAVYASPGAGIDTFDVGPGLAIMHCTVERKPDEQLAPGEKPRFLSSNADAINVLYGAGSILIEDNQLSDEGDDAIVLRGGTARARTSDGQVLNIDGNGQNDFKAGDLVSLYDGKTLALLAHAAPIEQILSGRAFKLATALGRMPSDQSVVISLDRLANSNAVVRNNHIHDSSGRGILVHGDNMLVEGNTIERTGLSGIQLMGTPGDFPPVHNVIVRGNIISHVNSHWYGEQAGSQRYSGAFVVYASPDDKTVSPVPVDADIAILGNRIEDTPGVGLYIASASNVTVSGNTIDGVNRGGLFRDASPVIYVDPSNTRNVQIR